MSSQHVLEHSFPPGKTHTDTQKLFLDGSTFFVLELHKCHGNRLVFNSLEATQSDREAPVSVCFKTNNPVNQTCLWVSELFLNSEQIFPHWFCLHHWASLIKVCSVVGDVLTFLKELSATVFSETENCESAHSETERLLFHTEVQVTRVRETTVVLLFKVLHCVCVEVSIVYSTDMSTEKLVIVVLNEVLKFKKRWLVSKKFRLF